MMGARVKRKRDQGDDGGQGEEETVGVRRDVVFLGEQLDAVGNGLQKSVPADAHGAEALLDVAGDLALHPGQRNGQEKQDPDDDGHLDHDQAEGEKGFHGHP